MDRREFVSTPLVTAAMTASSVLAQETPRYDMVLKGGHVIDPANKIDRQMDVAVLVDECMGSNDVGCDVRELLHRSVGSAAPQRSPPR